MPSPGHSSELIEQPFSIREPMLSGCRLAVLIPVYGENFNMVLRPLLSLAVQRDVQPEQFEIEMVINNKKSEAKSKSAEYKLNQKNLKL